MCFVKRDFTLYSGFATWNVVSVYKHGLSIDTIVVFPGVCLNMRLWPLD